MKRLKLYVLASLALSGILMFAQNANAQVGYAISELDYYESDSRIEGYSATILNYGGSYYYDVSVDGTLFNQTFFPVAQGSNNGGFVAEVYTEAYNTAPFKGAMIHFNSPRRECENLPPRLAHCFETRRPVFRRADGERGREII